MRIVVLAIAVLVAAAPSFGVTVDGIQSRNPQPIARRGGVLMLPLMAQRPGDHWPETIEIKLADDRTITGQVAWLEPAAVSLERHWTDDPRGLFIRPVKADDDSAALPAMSMLGPYALARLPDDGDGTLRVGDQVLTPVWRDVPHRMEAGGVERAAMVMTMTPTPDRPDSVSPFEYWRWALLAERMEMDAPAPFGNEITAMAAEHYADLWRIGLQRLKEQSERIATQCRNLLTQTCIDRRQPFAAWVADPGAVSVLLSRLLDFNRSEQMILSDAVSWIDEQPQIYLWPVSEFGDEVRLAIMTPRSEPIVAKFRWQEDGAGKANTMAARIEPGVLTEVRVRRMPLPGPPAIGLAPPPEPLRQVLQIEAGQQKLEIGFGPRVVHAKPPGVFFRALSPPLTLAEAQLRQQRGVTDEHATLAQVRRLAGRWEIFLDCRRGGAAKPETARQLPELITSYTDLRGIEAITILLGPEVGEADARAGARGPAIWLTIPEDGFHRVVGGMNDGTLQIHKKSFEDRWNCRIVLPEAWFSAAETSPALVGFIRSHGDGTQVETGPNPCTPWRPSPTRAAIELDQWDDLPTAE